MKRLSERTNEQPGFIPSPVVSFDEEVPPNMHPPMFIGMDTGNGIDRTVKAKVRIANGVMIIDSIEHAPVGGECGVPPNMVEVEE